MISIQDEGNAAGIEILYFIIRGAINALVLETVIEGASMFPISFVVI